MKKTVILAGAGHSHLEVIRLLSKKEIAAHRFVLISPNRKTFYSGLIPRLIMGDLEVSRLMIPSAEFALGKGFHFQEDSIQSINQMESTILLGSGKTEAFDILSLNIGGVSQKFKTQSPLNTIYLRPFEEFIQRWQVVEKGIRLQRNPRFVVVGGGAAAVEVAIALRQRLIREAIQKSQVILVTRGSRLCETYSLKTSNTILKNLKDNQIQVFMNEGISEILSEHIQLSDGHKVEFDSIFMVVPTLPHSLVSAPTDASLRLAPNVFAVGDCVRISKYPELPRSGVVAVHQGRHLVGSLRQALQGQEPSDFVPRPTQLNILITSGESARLVWGKRSLEGGFAFQIKKWIDENYVRQFLV